MRLRIFSICLCIVLFLSGCGPFSADTEKEKPVTQSSFYLNTSVSITLYGKDAEELIEECFRLCGEYEAIFSRTLEDSELYAINHRAKGTRELTVSDHMAALLEEALTYCRLSDGAFDITVEPVSSLWNFTSEELSVPDAQAIREALPLIGYEQISLSGNKLTFENDAVRLDLGAIAKGYIADCLKEFLTENGVQRGIINLGGNILCLGTKPDGSPFRIGIQKPFADRNVSLCTTQVSGTSVVSSGIYERCFEQDGQFYHHILNPAEGYPYDNGLVAVTILSETSVQGDGLSTSCFALGPEKGIELLNRLENVYGLFLLEDGTYLYSKGAEGKFQF